MAVMGQGWWAASSTTFISFRLMSATLWSAAKLTMHCWTRTCYGHGNRKIELVIIQKVDSVSKILFKFLCIKAEDEIF